MEEIDGDRSRVRRRIVPLGLAVVAAVVAVGLGALALRSEPTFASPLWDQVEAVMADTGEPVLFLDVGAVREAGFPTRFDDPSEEWERVGAGLIGDVVLPWEFFVFFQMGQSPDLRALWGFDMRDVSMAAWSAQGTDSSMRLVLEDAEAVASRLGSLPAWRVADEAPLTFVADGDVSDQLPGEDFEEQTRRTIDTLAERRFVVDGDVLALDVPAEGRDPEDLDDLLGLLDDLGAVHGFVAPDHGANAVEAPAQLLQRGEQEAHVVVLESESTRAAVVVAYASAGEAEANVAPAQANIDASQLVTAGTAAAQGRFLILEVVADDATGAELIGQTVWGLGSGRGLVELVAPE